MSPSPRFCIYGAGAVGGMIGTLLARAGVTVNVVAHGETLAAIRRDGLRLIGGGETLQAEVRAKSRSAESVTRRGESRKAGSAAAFS